MYAKSKCLFCHFRQNDSDHVTQQLSHDVKRVQHFGLLDFYQLKGLISEDDYEASVVEWA